MAPNTLDDRKRRILKVITDDYIASAEPVGSRTIARKYNLGLSPATIRNEMADLEEEGYLQQPHTSSGRIPSDLGYRYYVDALMERRHLRTEEMEAIKRKLAEREHVLDSLIHHVAHILAQITRYPSMILPPNNVSALFKCIRLVKLNERNILLLVVSNTGQVENKIIDCEFDLSELEIEQLSDLLNKQLYNRSIFDVKETLAKEIAKQMKSTNEFFHRACQALIDGMRTEGAGQVVMDGASQILDQPEFTERDHFRPLLNLLEQEESLYRLLAAGGQGGLTVSIGQENKDQAVHECSVVTAVYEINGRTLGTIGVLGPTRMDYAKVLTVVEFMASHLSSILNNMAGSRRGPA